MGFRRLAALLFAHLAITWGILAFRPSRPELLVEMTSSAISRAQVYYDTGSGLSEDRSESVTVFGTGRPEILRLPLPNSVITGLRFDPLINPGTIVIHRAAVLRSDGSTAFLFRPAQIRGILGFDQMDLLPTGLRYHVRDDSYDPQLMLDLSAPVDLRSRWPRSGVLALVACCNALLFCSEMLVLFWRPLLAHKANDSVRAAAERMSNSDFIVFDRLALWFYIAAVCFFAVCAVADLNGSSMGIFYLNYKVGAAPRLIAGVPQGIRADEFNYETPAILNQIFRDQPFELEKTPLGARSVGLLASIPVKHVTTWLRPQYWPFFVVRADYAFSAWWQAKGLIFTVGLFTFLLLLTGSSSLALTGTLWLFFSQFTQWGYSWPSMLPEMCGLFCLVLVFAAYLSVGRNTLALAMSAIGCAACAIDFALCAYVPHLVPYVWAGVILAIAWSVAKRDRILRGDGRGRRVIAFVGCAALTGILLADIERTVDRAVPAIAATIYPGQRSLGGGGYGVDAFATHFLAASENEHRFPPEYSNINEAAGFLWLAPVTLLSFRKMRALTRERRILLMGLWAGAVFLLCWLLLPIPASVGRFLVLNRVQAVRMLPALGLLNTAIVMLVLSSPARRRGLPTALKVLLFALAFYAWIWVANQHLHGYFHTQELVLGTLWATALAVLLLEGRRTAFAAVVIVPNVFLFALVNPIQRGIDTVTNSALFDVVRGNRQLLKGKWLVYAGGFPASIFTETGCDVFNGLRYMPDVDDFPVYRRHHVDVNALNNLGYLEAAQAAEGTPASATLNRYGPILNVNPFDPLVKDLGIRYIAFHDLPSESIRARLRPLANGPVGEFWLYELP